MTITYTKTALDSTPIINGLVDAYALFRFLRFRPWHDWQEFNGHVSRIEKKNRASTFARCASSVT